MAAFCAAFPSGPLAAAEILDAELVAATEAVDHAFAIPDHHLVSAGLVPLGQPAPGAPPGLTWLSGPCAGPEETGTAGVCVLRIHFAPRHRGVRYRLRLEASPYSPGDPDEVDEDSAIGPIVPPLTPGDPDEVDEDSAIGPPFAFSPPGPPRARPNPSDPDEVDEDS